MSESFPVVLPPSFFGPVSDPPSDGEAAPRANPSGAGEGRGTDRRRSGPRAAVPALEREISLVRQLISASPRPVRRRTAEGSARKPGAGRAPVGNGALRGPGAQSGPTSPPQDVTAPLGPRSRRVASPRAGALDEVFLNSPPRPGRRTAADPIDVMAPSFPVGDERMHRRSVMRTVARQRQQRQGADQSAPPLPATATDNHVTPAPATEARDPAGRAAPLPLAPPAPTFSQSQLDALVTAAARQAAEHVMARMAAAGARSEGGPGASVPAPTPPSPMPATETRTSPLSEAAPTPSEPVVVPTGSASTLVTRPAEDATELVAAAAQERVVGTQRRATTLHLRRLEEEVGALEQKMQALQRRRRQRKVGPPPAEKAPAPAARGSTASSSAVGGGEARPPSPAAARPSRSRAERDAGARSERQMVLPAEGVLVPDRMVSALVDYARAFERHAQIRDLGLRGSGLSQWQVVELLAESILEEGIAEALGDVEGALDDVVAAVADVV